MSINSTSKNLQIIRNPNLDVHSPSLKNLDGIENQLETKAGTINREIVYKVAHYIANNPSTILDPSQKKRVLNHLEKKIKQIKNNTEGFIAFFKYLFRRKLKIKKIEERKIYESLKKIIDKLQTENKKTSKNEIPKKEQHSKKIDSPGQKTVEEPEMTKKEADLKENTKSSPASNDEALKIKEPDTHDETSSDSTLNAPNETINDSSETINDPNGTANDSPIPPPPPPLPVKVQKTEKEAEAEWDLNEQKRLEIAFQIRADPNTYYGKNPPEHSILTVLTEKEKILKNEISQNEKLLKSFKTNTSEKDVKKQIESSLKEIKENLEKTKIEMEGSKTVMKSSGGKKTSEFERLLQNLTNEELKIIIGIAYDGQKPKPQEKSNYNSLNQNNKKFLDQIFDDWANISKSTVAKTFLKNQEGWKRLLEINKRDFTDTYIERMEKKKEEPKHITRTYADRNKKISTSVNVNQQINGLGGSLSMKEMLMKGTKLKKVSNAPNNPQQSNKSSGKNLIREALSKKFKKTKKT